MEFLGVPDDFGSVFGELVYKIAGAGSSDVVDVEVIADGELMGIKRFANKGEIIEVNAAGYLKSCINPVPAGSETCRFVLPGGRSVAASIKAGGVLSPERVFVGSVGGGVETAVLLSHLPEKRVLGEGEYDELSFAIAGGLLSASITVGQSAPFAVPVASMQAPKGIATLVIDAGHIAATAKSIGKNFADCGSAKVTVAVGGSVIAQVEYTLRRKSPGQVRMAWVNYSGMVDYYTFASVATERTEAEKERLKLESGFKTVTVSRAKVDTLASGYVTPETAHVLAEIVGAEKVWRIDGSSHTPVEVITDNVVVTSGSLASVTLEVRKEI